jgi:hypothetical protein
LSEARVLAAQKRYRDDIARTDDSREELRDAIYEELRAGVSQSEVGRMLGWHRQALHRFIQPKGEA